uniref:FH2 domain-containing protein n=1 Tax=Arion vulgaris TaxID=1028688 RepID=A0A0B7ACP5_9EUPU
MDKLLLDKLRVSTDNIHGSLGRTLPVKDSGVQTEINMSSMAGQNINGAGEDVIFNALTSPSSGERIFKNGDIDQYVSKTDPASYNSIGNILPVNGSLGSDYVVATSAVGAFNSSPASNSAVINNVPPPPPLPGMGGPPPPPPPPPLPGMGGPPPPPPLPGMGGPPPPPPPPGMGGPPLPPPPPGIGGPPRPPLLLGSAPAQRQSLHYITTPTPKHKMKTFNWSKIPAQSLNSDDSVWKEVLEMEDQVAVQYDKIEQLFCQKTEDTTKKEEPLKAKANTEVNLLDMKRSMNANIFLKQFKGSHADIIQLIKDGDTVKIGAERLRGLHKILPDKDEIEMIKNYDGDRSKLGNAEKFFSVLSELPGYKIRIEGMLLKDDFRTAIDSLKPNVEVVIRACNKLLEDTSLKGFLRFVLHAGNFINAGGYAGNALGFKVSSLNKLMDTRANKPRVTLLHYLVEEAGKEQDDVLSFADNMSQTLTEASRLTVDSLSSETRQLEGNVKQLKTQVSKSENEIQEYFAGFIKDAENEVNVMQGKLSEIKELTTKLAIHFCEPEKTFKLEECLNTFNTFCQKVKQCIKDNEQRKVQEERTEKRRLENEAMKANKGNKEPKIPQEEDGCIIDNLLKDIRKGFKLRKASIKRSDSQRTPVKLKGNVNSEVNSPESKTANETISEAPEIIPVTGKKEESVC